MTDLCDVAALGDQLDAVSAQIVTLAEAIATGIGSPLAPVPVANGGTGAGTAAGARAAFGLGGTYVTDYVGWDSADPVVATAAWQVSIDATPTGGDWHLPDVAATVPLGTPAGNLRITRQMRVIAPGAQYGVLTSAAGARDTASATTLTAESGILNAAAVVAIASNGQTLPQSTVHALSIPSNMPRVGSVHVATSDHGSQSFSYTSIVGNDFIGCTGGIGTLVTGAAIGANAITTLQVAALTKPMTVGGMVVLTGGGMIQRVTVAVAASIGATSIVVTGCTPYISFPIGTTVVQRDYLLDMSMAISTSGCSAVGLSFDLTASPTLIALRAHNWSADGLVENCKFRAGQGGLDVGNCDSFTAQHLTNINQSTPNAGPEPGVSFGTREGDAGLPTITLRDIVYSMSLPSLTVEAAISYDSIGNMSIFDGLVQFIDTSDLTKVAHAGIACGSPHVTVSAEGHIIFLTGCQTDGIRGPGVSMLNVREAHHVNGWYSSLPQRRSTIAGSSTGVAPITQLTVLSLASAATAGQTLKLISADGAFTQTGIVVAAPGAVAGASVIPVASFTPNHDYAVGAFVEQWAGAPAMIIDGGREHYLSSSTRMSGQGLEFKATYATPNQIVSHNVFFPTSAHADGSLAAIHFTAMPTNFIYEPAYVNGTSGAVHAADMTKFVTAAPALLNYKTPFTTDLTVATHGYGAVSGRPAASPTNRGMRWYDPNTTTETQSDGASWNVISTNTTVVQPDPVENLFNGGHVYRESERRTLASINLAAFVSGQAAFVALPLYAGDVITNLTFHSATTGFTLGNNNDSHWWVALYDIAGNLIAQSADFTTEAWAANSPKTKPLSAPYTVPATGIYYACVMVNIGTGTNTPAMGTMRGVAGSSNLFSGAALAGMVRLAATDVTHAGLTATAAAIATLASTAGFMWAVGS